MLDFDIKTVSQTLQWRHNGRNGVSNHQPRHCLLNRLFRRRSKKTSKLRVIGLCTRNTPVTGEFPAQRASNAENVSIWWRHHGNFMNWSNAEFPDSPVIKGLSFSIYHISAGVIQSWFDELFEIKLRASVGSYHAFHSYDNEKSIYVILPAF